MRVALLHNARPAAASADLPDDTFEEYDGPDTLKAISEVLEGLGCKVIPVEANWLLARALMDWGIDFAFNIAEGVGRRSREAVPAAACELMQVPYTGSDPLTLAVTLDKAVARRLVSPEVPVALGCLIEEEADLAGLEALAYPVLVKPNDEGSSKGIRGGPVVHSPAEAAEKARWLKQNYGCPVLVEEFLPGTEVTVGLMGNGRSPRILGAMEIAPSGVDGAPFVYSLEVKRDWRRRVAYHVPPRLPAQTLAALERSALLAWRLLGCRDIARMDFRLDAAGLPRFIECNPLPGLNPVTGDIVLLSRHGLTYAELVGGIFRAALARYGKATP